MTLALPRVCKIHIHKNLHLQTQLGVNIWGAKPPKPLIRAAYAKYSSLSPQYTFIPIAVETLGALGDEALSFFRDLGHRISTVTAEPRSFQFLLQRLSVAIQYGNAACVVGTVPTFACLDDVYYL